jgi:hypothetical protein
MRNPRGCIAHVFVVSPCEQRLSGFSARLPPPHPTPCRTPRKAPEEEREILFEDQIRDLGPSEKSAAVRGREGGGGGPHDVLAGRNRAAGTPKTHSDAPRACTPHLLSLAEK